ncbi:hypothetical protein AVEN_4412-1 [Araneus ventricosus]|uniref:Homeotic protein proboscipedia n=1 Tax=Araneus ventricosus TaxID=182803 RepID=A0A4Y2QYR6_ARAVE|nr:hypothetical protein AVEN_4412-1 [Araneus ventricosus]
MEGGGGSTAMESGFINSQPSMAEFMTALPHINETFHRGSSITGGGSAQSLCPPPAQQTSSAGIGGGVSPDSAAADNPKHPNGYSGVAVPEYPWMKEKKTTRKQQQGKTLLTNILCEICSRTTQRRPEATIKLIKNAICISYYTIVE